MMNGIIVINKGLGFTSHDVVAKMRGICGQKKIGHTGTLDPGATGVLPVCLGSGTKLSDMLMDSNKEYVAELLLGVRTDTQDMTGTVLSDSYRVLSQIKPDPASEGGISKGACQGSVQQENPEGQLLQGATTESLPVTEPEVRQACESFLGEYLQVPPMYSALKVNGKKLYELARSGREVERKPRAVSIIEMEILQVCLPVVKLRVVCSKGTYIRTLCADIGERLGVGGTMKSLKRTKAGGFTLGDAITLEELQQYRDHDRLEEVVRPVESVFNGNPQMHVHKDWERLLINGNAILPAQTVEKEVYAPGRWVCFYGTDGVFAGIYAYDGEKGRYQCVKKF